MTTIPLTDSDGGWSPYLEEHMVWDVYTLESLTLLTQVIVITVPADIKSHLSL